MLQRVTKSIIRSFSRNPFSFSGKLSVITGGAGSIGFASVKSFLESGSNVCMVDSNEESLAKRMKELQEFETEESCECFPVICDVTNKTQVDDLVEKIESDYGEIDILINNAGIVNDSLMWNMTEAMWDEVIDVNLKGTFLTGTAVAKKMMERGAGSICNMSSIVGLYGNSAQSNYAASKFGVIGLTKTWANELGPLGIRVNAVAPGFTLTEIIESVPEKMLDKFICKTPLRRMALPKEIASAFLFLSSEEHAGFITGHVLEVSGGLVP